MLRYSEGSRLAPASGSGSLPPAAGFGAEPARRPLPEALRACRLALQYVAVGT